MKTKIIPFDLETAKKIQAGEIEGRIVADDGLPVRIIYWDRENQNYPIVGLYLNITAYYYSNDGISFPLGKETHRIFLEVPDNESQFAPFDKVLVRNKSNERWHPSLYATTDGLLYYTTDCKNWQQCILYEGHEHLVGTTNKPKEE